MAGRNLYPADIETAVKHESIRPGCIAAVAAPEGGLAIVVEPKASKPRAKTSSSRAAGSERWSRARPAARRRRSRSSRAGRCRRRRAASSAGSRSATRSRPTTGCWPGSTSDDHFHGRPHPRAPPRRARGRHRRAGRRVPRRRVAQRRRRRLPRPDRRAAAASAIRSSKTWASRSTTWAIRRRCRGWRRSVS